MKTFFAITTLNKLFHSDIWDDGIFNGLWKIASTYPIQTFGIIAVIIGCGYVFEYLDKNFSEKK